MQEREGSFGSRRAGDTPTHPPNSDEGNDGDGGLTESRVSQNRDVPNGSGGDEGNQSTNSDF